MIKARDNFGFQICARCGKIGEKMTKDHFIPKSCKMNVNGDGNLVEICETCNKEKGCMIVKPEWYQFLSKEQQNKLLRYMRYARSYILTHTEDEEILEFVKQL